MASPKTSKGIEGKKPKEVTQEQPSGTRKKRVVAVGKIAKPKK
jgi:hypothetical protein